MESTLDYKDKYLKYKRKYLYLQKQLQQKGGIFGKRSVIGLVDFVVKGSTRYITDGNIKYAVNDYLHNKEEAIKKYGDISEWDVSKVTNMEWLFFGAETFNEDISEWNVDKVTNMWCMFRGAKKFNRDLSNWNVGKVTGKVTSMEGMFMK